MEIGEGLMGKRANEHRGVELVVRCVNDRTCFVALPRLVASALTAAGSAIPLPLAVSPRANWAGRKESRTRSSEPRVGSGHQSVTAAKSTQVRDASRNSEVATPRFTAWAGAVGSDGAIELSLALADCLGLVDGQPVLVVGLPGSPIATAVDVSPETQSDWALVIEHANSLERTALSQVGIVGEDQAFPFWPGGGSSSGGAHGGVIRLRATRVSPKSECGVARLGLQTELRVAPWVGTPPAGGYVVVSGATAPGVTGVTGATDMTAMTGVSGPSKPQPPPAVPVLLRAQSSRGVVVAWPRRMRGDGDDDEFGAVFKQHSTQQILVAPTASAFISKQTSIDCGIPHGAVVAVRVGDGATGAGESNAKDSSKNDSNAATVRVVVVGETSRVADGHVVLTPCLLRKLGAAQGTRVIVVETTTTEAPSVSEVANPDEKNDTPQKNLLRVRPVLSGEPKETTSSDAGTPRKSFLEKLESSHLAVLGIDRHCSPEQLELALGTLVNGWVKTVCRFNGSVLPKKDEDEENFVPVSTETVFKFHLDSEDGSGDNDGNEKTSTSVSFQLELRAAGSDPVVKLWTKCGVAEFMKTTRVELGDCVPKNFQKERPNRGGPSNSKLFGDAVRVDPCLGVGDFSARHESNDEWNDTGDFVIRMSNFSVKSANTADDALGAAVVTEIAAATTRLASMLASNTPRNYRPSTAGALLYGKPGCGRSASVLAVARRLRDDVHVSACVVVVDCAKVPVGDPRPAIAALRHAARVAMQLAPSVIVLDDLDVLAPCDGGDGAGESGQVSHGRIVGEVLGDLMDATSGDGLVAWIATANSPASLAKPVLMAGRLDHVGELRAPDGGDGRASRLAAAAYARGTPVCETCDLQKIARGTDGFERRDLDLLVERAAVSAAARSFGLNGEDFFVPNCDSFGRHENENARDPGGLRLGGAPRTATERNTRTAMLQTRDLLRAKTGFAAAPDRALGKDGGAGSKKGDSKKTTGPTFEDVGGLAEAKQLLDEALSFPLLHADVFAHAPLRLRTGALLYGPPGCGKTLLAHAAVKGAGLRLITIKGPSLLNKYIGQSEAGVRDVFKRAKDASPCCLFFDEFDAIAPKRGHDTTGVTDRVVNAFLTELDGVEGLTGVVVLAATSRPDLIDPALLRPGRLDRTLFLPFPNERERREILWSKLNAPEDDTDTLNLVEVARRTDGFSGADLAALLSDAARLAETREGADASATAEDVAAALRGARASVSQRERQRLEAIYARFRGDESNTNTREGERGGRTAHA